MNHFLNGLSILMVLYIVFFILYRIWEKNGFKVKKRLTRANTGELVTRKDAINVFKTVFSFRIIVFLLSIIIYIIYMKGDSPFHLMDAIHNWNKWDATNYLRIAEGYDTSIVNGLYHTLAFFPLYPLFIRILSFVFEKYVAALIVSNVASSLACVFIYKLVSMDYDRKTARLSLVLLNIFPFAFFFSSIMSEGVFLLFSALTLYYIRKHNWVLACISGVLCALSRSIGVFIIFPALVEAIEEYQLLKRIRDYKYVLKTFVRVIIPILLISLGFGIYLCLNYKYGGEWFYFIRLQREIWFESYDPFYHFFSNCWGMIGTYGRDYTLCVAIPQIIVIIFAYIVLSLNVKRSITMYSVWLLVNIIINTSLSWPLSICRYMACAIPLFIFLANYLKKHRCLLTLYIILCLILYGIYFVVYLTDGPIM